jgi:hypothetical protein
VNRFKRWLLGEVNQNLQYIWIRLIQLEERINAMSAAFDLMEAKIQELKTVDDSVLALVTQLVAAVQGAATLEEAQQIVGEIDVEKTRLAAAVQANT